MSACWPPAIAPSGPLGKYRPAVRRRRNTRFRLHAEAVDQLRQLLSAGPPGVIICAQLKAMPLLQDAGIDGWRVIGQYHASFEAAANSRDLRRALRNYRDVSTVALLTAQDAALFADAGLKNTRWIPNPLAYWPVDAADLAGRTVTYLGRLSRRRARASCWLPGANWIHALPIGACSSLARDHLREHFGRKPPPSDPRAGALHFGPRLRIRTGCCSARMCSPCRR